MDDLEPCSPQLAAANGVPSASRPRTMLVDTCPYCSKRFLSSSRLERHMKSSKHSSAFSSACPVNGCGYTGNLSMGSTSAHLTAADLAQHLRFEHNRSHERPSRRGNTHASPSSFQLSHSPESRTNGESASLVPPVGAGVDDEDEESEGSALTAESELSPSNGSADEDADEDDDASSHQLHVLGPGLPSWKHALLVDALYASSRIDSDYLGVVVHCLTTNVTREAYSGWLTYLDPSLLEKLPTKFDNLITKFQTSVCKALGLGRSPSLTSAFTRPVVDPGSGSAVADMVPVATVIKFWLANHESWTDVVLVNSQLNPTFRRIIEGSLDPYAPSFWESFHGSSLREAWNGDRFFQSVSDIRSTVATVRRAHKMEWEDVWFVHVAVHVDGFPFGRKGGSADIINLTLMETPCRFRSNGASPSVMPIAICSAASEDEKDRQSVTDACLKTLAEQLRELQTRPICVETSTGSKKYIWPLVYGFPVDGKARNDLLALASYGTNTRCCPYCTIHPSDYLRYAEAQAGMQCIQPAVATMRCGLPSDTDSHVRRAFAPVNADQGLQRLLNFEYGLVGPSVLCQFPGVNYNNVWNACPVDMFHLEGEGECEKVIRVCGAVFVTVISGFWAAWSKQLRSYGFVGRSSKMPLFKSFKGWRFLMTGIDKIHSMLVAPVTMYPLLADAISEGQEEILCAWKALIHHWTYLKELYRRQIPSFLIQTGQLALLAAEAKTALWNCAQREPTMEKNEIWTPNAHVACHVAEQIKLHSSLWGVMVTPFESEIHFAKMTYSRHSNGKGRNKSIIERLFTTKCARSLSHRRSANTVECIGGASFREGIPVPAAKVKWMCANLSAVFMRTHLGEALELSLFKPQHVVLRHGKLIVIAEKWIAEETIPDEVFACPVFNLTTESVEVLFDDVTEMVEVHQSVSLVGGIFIVRSL